ncbi:MAG: TldD/PmbA family protein [Bacteroidaceae bacterium]|nr:TldD/PmbA family protein [Bacteroidaceae bacterium]
MMENEITQSVLCLPHADKVLDEALSRGGDYAEIFVENTTVHSLELQDQRVSQTQQSLIYGAGIRVLKDSCTGYAYTMDLSMPAMMNAARFAATAGNGGERLSAAALPHVTAMPLLEDYVSIELMKKRLLLLDETVRNLDGRIIKVKAAVATRDQQVLFVNSQGCSFTDYRPRASVFLRVVMEQDGQTQMGFATLSLQKDFHQFSETDFTDLAKTAVSRTAFLFDAVQPEGGEMPVVMAPGASGILMHEAIGHAFEADFNRVGTSIFAGKMGQRVCRPEVTIVDDGTQAEDVGFLRWDDEGIPGQRTVLVDKGVLNSYMHDRISARHYGVEPTGNGRRESFRHAPQPRMRSTYMMAGESDPEDIIRSVKKGIYAQVFTNGQVQIGAGDFTFYMKQGYLIEDGHLTQPIRDINVIGNGPRALADISMVGNDLLIDHSASMCGKGGQSVPVSQGLPTVLVDKLVVG